LNITLTHMKVKGFSLIEMLIAMVLGLILISSMIAVFAGNKHSSEMNSATADLQESARFALDQMARDVRMAGFIGCLNVNANAVEIISKGAPSDDLRLTVSSGAVVDAADTWDPPIPGYTPPTNNPAKPGSHVLLMQYGGPDTAELTGLMSSGGTPSRAAPIEVSDDLGMTSGDVAIISNCEFADLFTVTAIGGSETEPSLEHAVSGNKTGAVTRAYGDMATIAETLVMKFNSNIYYVGETGETNSAGDKLYSLYQQTLPYDATNNPPVELVTGVENLRVSYGQRDLATNGIRYLSADHDDFNPMTVDSIRIGILMVSYDQVTDRADDSTYVLAGQSILPAGANVDEKDTHPKDKRIRLAFNTTIQIRNKREL